MAQAGGTVVLLLSASVAVAADDYVRNIGPSPAAYAHFSAVPENLPETKVSCEDKQKRGFDDAYFTKDGGISIPPGCMVKFDVHGHCMDPHLPAPCQGEPMQFVDVGKLVPAQLREMYGNLMERERKGDRTVLACNPQHLVWAIRTAGTDDPMANSLSDEQLAVLDDCAGSRGAFMRYHERIKRRNAKKKKREGRRDAAERDAGTVSVGRLTYNASELSGTNGAQRVQEHIEQLAEMGRSTSSSVSSCLRYGEVEEDVYTDVVCNGGLSFAARILNASGSRRVFRVSDFVAQMGHGRFNDSRRQRITMEEPEEFILVRGASSDGVEIDWNVFEAEADGEIWQNTRRQTRRSRRETTVEERKTHDVVEQDTYRRRRIVDRETVEEEPDQHVPDVPIEETNKVVRVVPGEPESHAPPGEIPDIEPVEPVKPISGKRQSLGRGRAAPRGEVSHLFIRVISLEYDEGTHTGTLILEVRHTGRAYQAASCGLDGEACAQIRRNLKIYVRDGGRRHDPPLRLPLRAEYELDDDGGAESEPIAVKDGNLYEVKFRERGFEAVAGGEGL